KQCQSIDHTAIVIESVLLTINGFDLVSIELTVTICIVPVVIAILVLAFLQIVARNNLEPTFGYASTVLRIVKVHEGFRVSIKALTAFTCSSSSSSHTVPITDHTTILVKAISLAIDGFSLNGILT